MNRTRVALAAAAVLSTALLAGCGGSHDLSPHTNACRVYELQAGTDVPALKTEITRYAAGTLDDASSLTSGIKVVRESAVNAGLTKNLPDKDYRLFKQLVESADTLGAKLLNDDGGTPLDVIAAPFQKALDDVAASCA